MTKGNNIPQKKEDYDKSSEWKNWLVFINNTHNKLDELEEIGSKAYFDKKYLNLFFAKLDMFIAVRSSYLDDPEEVILKLSKVGSAIFKPKYIKDLNDGFISANLQEFQYKCMRSLNTIFRSVCIELSNSEIIPKVKKIKKQKQKASMKGNSL